LERVKDKIRQITKRNRGVSLEQVIGEINLLLPGWVRYFRLEKYKSLFQNLDSWIRRKLRCLRLKQLKGTYTIQKELQNLGVCKHRAWIIALSGKGWWRKAKSPQLQTAMNNAWFETKGLKSAMSIYATL
jgi:hypothetical protein